MICEPLDPLFVLLILAGAVWAALIFTGLVYGLRVGR
jgi:hypothetical protein